MPLRDESTDVRAVFEQLRRIGCEKVKGDQPVFVKQPLSLAEPGLPLWVLFVAVLRLDRPVFGLLILRQQDAKRLRRTEQVGM